MIDVKPKNYYQNLRQEVADYIDNTPKFILEIGCGEGNFGHAIGEKYDAEVWGIEPTESYANKAKQKLHKVYIDTVENALEELPQHKFDLIVANDVLEHLVDPYTVLKTFHKNLAKQGRVISSIPNMRNFHVFYQLSRHKNWEYQESGVLDRTHLRFFTTNSIKNMYDNCGYSVIKHEGINPETNLPRWFNLLNTLSGKRFDDMRFLQFVTVAEVRK